MTESIEQCLECEEEFESSCGAAYCEICGDPREGYQTFDEMLAGRIDYLNWKKEKVFD